MEKERSKAEEIYKLSETLADEAYGNKGLYLYSERQELASQFNNILVEWYASQQQTSKEEGWISIKDRVPDKDSKETYLIHTDSGIIDIAWISAGLLQAWAINSNEITHWQYLPKKPENNSK